MDHQRDDGPEPVNTENTPDTGDLIGRDAPDPRPEPVTDPDHPSYVEPAHAAVRVNPDMFAADPAPPRQHSEGAPPQIVQRMNELAAELTQLLRETTGREDVYLTYDFGAVPPLETPVAAPSGTVGTSLPDAPDTAAEADPEGCA